MRLLLPILLLGLARGFLPTKIGCHDAGVPKLDHHGENLDERNRRMLVSRPSLSWPATTRTKNDGAALFATSNDNAETTSSPKFQLTIEYCTGCRWGLRAFWFAQELLSTFEREPRLAAVTLQPSRPSSLEVDNDPVEGGRFRVYWMESNDATLLWDRKEQDGFPPIKELKQMVRDVLNPALFLGHSDTADQQELQQQQQAVETTDETAPVVIDLTKDKDIIPPPRTDDDGTLAPSDIALLGNADALPNIAIAYCTGCKWLLRAAYYAQELTATTFADEIQSVTLIPSRDKGGAFVVTATTTTTQTLWDRTVDGGFPETKLLKQRVRDVLNPQKDLGHADVEPKKTSSSSSSTTIDTMDDDEAEEARKYFGVA